jgi:O-antigen ligase
VIVLYVFANLRYQEEYLMTQVIFFYVFLVALWSETVLGYNLSIERGLSYLNVAFYPLLLGWVFLSIRTKKLFEGGRVNKFVGLLFFIVCLSILVSFIRAENGQLSLYNEIILFKRWVLPFLVFLILYRCLSEEKHCFYVCGGLVIFLVVTLFTTIGTISGLLELGASRIHISGVRVAGFVESNQYAAFLVLFIPLFISGTYFSGKANKKVLYGTLLLLSLICLIVTASRGGGIALFCSVLVYFYLFCQERLIRFRVALLLLVIGIPLFLVFAFTFAPEDVRVAVSERFDPSRAEDAREFTSGRTDLWTNGIELFLRKPVLGHGQDTFIPLMKKNFVIWGNSHNDYLSYLVHFGIIGLSVFLLLLWSLFREARVIARNVTDMRIRVLSLSYISGLSGYVVAMFGVNIIQPQFLFWGYTAAVLKWGRLQLRKEGMSEKLWS